MNDLQPLGYKRSRARRLVSVQSRLLFCALQSVMPMRSDIIAGAEAAPGNAHRWQCSPLSRFGISAMLEREVLP